MLAPFLTSAQDDALDQPVTLIYDTMVSGSSDTSDYYPFFNNASRQNLHLTLLRYDVASKAIVPYLAETYSVSEDGLIYTFNLRNDVYWVRYHNGQVIRGQPVTAYDVVNHLQDKCQGIDFSRIPYRRIRGCDGSSSTAAGIRASDDHTLIIELSQPAAYLPALLTEPSTGVNFFNVFSTDLSELYTNGPFLLRSVKQEGDKQVFVFMRNPHLPEDLWQGGNIDEVVLDVFDSQSIDFNAFFMGTLDGLTLPRDVGFGYMSDQPHRVPDTYPSSMVTVMVFNPDKPPFDNIQVRRAFSAAINREEAFPFQANADRFGSSSIFGSLPVDESDGILGYDPVYAREQLAAAGYANCEGLPTITATISEFNERMISSLISQFESSLNCDESVFDVTVAAWDEVYRTVTGDVIARIVPGQVVAPTNQQRPSVWFINSFHSFPDQAAQIGIFLDCNLSSWGICTESQALIDQSHGVTDPEIRSALWQEIERNLFGVDGEFPVAPLTFVTGQNLQLAQWIDGNPITFYDPLGNWSSLIIDQAEQRSARGTDFVRPEASAQVAPGESISGTISDASPVVAYSVVAGDDKVSILVSPADDSILDPVINVYDRNGALIAINDDITMRSRNAAVMDLPAQSEYTVVVYAFNAASTGDFVLRVTGGTLLGTIVSDGSVNVRSGPGTNFGVVTTATPGTEVEIVGRTADSSWLSIRINDIEGWIASFLITTDGNINELTILDL